MSKRIGLLSVVMGLWAGATGYAGDRDLRVGFGLEAAQSDSCFSFTLLTGSPSIFHENDVDRVSEDNEREIQEQIEPSSVFAPVNPPPFVAIEQTAAETIEIDGEQSPQQQEETHEQIELSILFTPSSEPLCELNAEAVAVAFEVDDEQSREKLNQAYESLADVIRNYAGTKAAEEASKMLDMAGLCVYPDGKLVPKGIYYSNR